jgi:hypothetical protein
VVDGHILQLCEIYGTLEAGLGGYDDCAHMDHDDTIQDYSCGLGWRLVVKSSSIAWTAGY